MPISPGLTGASRNWLDTVEQERKSRNICERPNPVDFHLFGVHLSEAGESDRPSRPLAFVESDRAAQVHRHLKPLQPLSCWNQYQAHC